MENNLVETKFNELFSPSDIEMLVKFDELESRVKTMKDAKNEAIKNFLKENNLKSYENDKIKVTYIEATERVSVDTKRLKEEGIYELYTKITPVKDSVKITIKYE